MVWCRSLRLWYLIKKVLSESNKNEWNKKSNKIKFNFQFGRLIKIFW